jgi:ABC-2 type transport system ATP-binding protein
MEMAVTLNNVVKRFGDFTAVDHVSLGIRKGEMFGILGPNGAGKTTIINMLLGLIKITSGNIHILGYDAKSQMAEAKKHIGMMTQETIVEAELTGRENLEMYANLYHIPKDEIQSKVDEALKEVDLYDFRDRRAGMYSGGMQRRLNVAKAMIHNPDILILDEPTVGLDIQNRVSMWNHIKRLNEKGVTIIMTTQYLEEADELCDRIAIIDHGRIKAIGTTSELKRLVGNGRILEIIAEKDDIDDIREIFEKDFGMKTVLEGDRIRGEIEEGKLNMLSKMLAQMDKRKLKVHSVSMHLPDLNDVFMKLTGSALRDTTGEMSSPRSIMWRR